MGNNRSVQSAVEGREPTIPSNHPIPEGSKANGWDTVQSEPSHFGWGPSSGSTGINDQGWLDKSSEAQHNGWGEKATESKNSIEKCSSDKPKPQEVSTSGWMDEPAKEEYNGWIREPAKEEFNGWMDEPINNEYNGWKLPQSMHPKDKIEGTQIAEGIRPSSYSSNDKSEDLAPSAPPLPYESLYEDTVYYPPIDSGLVDVSAPSARLEASTRSEAGEENSSSMCIICWESPIEGACVPCGHMAGCMQCLYEIKSKKGDCPVCRAKLDQVIRLYGV